MNTAHTNVNASLVRRLAPPRRARNPSHVSLNNGPKKTHPTRVLTKPTATSSHAAARMRGPSTTTARARSHAPPPAATTDTSPTAGAESWPVEAASLRRVEITVQARETWSNILY